MHTVPTIASGVPNSGAEIALVRRCFAIEGGLARRWVGRTGKRLAENRLDLLDRHAGLRPRIQWLCVGGAAIANKLTTVTAVPGILTYVCLYKL